MSIKEERLNRIVEDTIKKAIVEGHLPSSRETIQKINSIILTKDLRKPFFNFIPIKKGETTKAEKYNADLNNIISDLDILYNRYDYCTKQLDDAIKSFEEKKNNLLNQIKGLYDEVQTIIASFNNKGITDIFFDTFNDMSKVDAQNTTAVVNKKVYIKPLATRSRKLDVKPRTSVEFFGDSSISITTTGSTDNIYDEINIIGLSYLIKNKSDGPVSIRLTLDFSEYTTPAFSKAPNQPGTFINRIEFDGNFDVKAKIEYTPDGINTYELPYYPTSAPLQRVYIFPEILVKKLYITLTKENADNFNQNEYEYLFVLKQLKFYYLDYDETAVLQSKTFHTDKVINKISLSVDEETPETSYIEYYIQIEDEWIPISPLEDTAPKYPQVIDLMNVEPAASKIFSISSEVSPTSVELSLYTWNGMKFYQLGTIEHNVVDSIMYRGRNCITINGDIIPIDKDKPQLIYNGQGPVTINFFLFCTKNYTVTCMPVSDMNVTLRLNNTTLYTGSSIEAGTRISYQLQKGWNKFTVELDGTGFFDIGFNPMEYGNIYAENTPMKQVDFVTLQRNTKIQDHDRYAIKDGMVIVNKYIPDIEYELIYSFATKEIHDLKFKAVLYKNGSPVSPILKSYYINIV